MKKLIIFKFNLLGMRELTYIVTSLLPRFFNTIVYNIQSANPFGGNASFGLLFKF